jgi:hypothetical protein
MSIVAMKRKSRAANKTVSGYGDGFSLSGGRRSQGWVGHSSMGRGLNGTPFRGANPMAVGRVGGESVVNGGRCSVNDASIIKRSTMSNDGHIASRVRHPTSVFYEECNAANSKDWVQTYNEYDHSQEGYIKKKHQEITSGVTSGVLSVKDTTVIVSNTGLQMEYVANKTATNSSWTSTYTLDVNGDPTTSATTVDSDWDKDTDEHGDYYLMGGNKVITPSYPDIAYILDIDESNDVTGGLTYEAWVKLPTGTSLGTSIAYLMGPNTDSNGEGPSLALNRNWHGGIRISGAGGNLFNSPLATPGLISYGRNIGKLLHVVSYMYKYNDRFQRGTWINGQHYPANSTGTGTPGLDVFFNSTEATPNSGNFVVGNSAYTGLGPSRFSASGIQLYGFRVWHRQLSTTEVGDLYALGSNGQIAPESVVVCAKPSDDAGSCDDKSNKTGVLAVGEAATGAISASDYINGGLLRKNCLPTPNSMAHWPQWINHTGCDVNYSTPGGGFPEEWNWGT